MDIEDRTVTLEGSEHIMRSALDTLTSCCMQMAEILQSEQGGDRYAANSLNALLKKSKKQVELPTADQVEFWKSPEKAGWMYSQGEHIKTWRKRWFVLKQGFLFRFASADVGSSSKPRGVVDLSQVTDVTDGSSTTGRSNSIQLSTATGSKCYVAESETAQVEWISALEGSVAKIVKAIAGYDEEPHTGNISTERALAEQFKRFSSSASGSFDLGKSNANRGQQQYGPSQDRYSRYEGETWNQPTHAMGNQYVHVVNYGGQGRESSSALPQYASAPPADTSEPSFASYGSTGATYGNSIGGRSPYINMALDAGSVAGASMAGASMAGAHPPMQQETISSFQGYDSLTREGGYGSALPQATYETQVPAIGRGPPFDNEYPATYPGHLGHPSSTMASQYPYEPARPGHAPFAQSEATMGAISAVPFGMNTHQSYSNGGIPHGTGPNEGAGYTAATTNLLDAVTKPPPPPQSNSEWQVHYTSDGRPYYYNSVTKETTWDAPGS